MQQQHFEIGDIVISPQGKSPFRLTYIPSRPTYYDLYRGKYIHNDKWAQARSIIHYSGTENTSMDSKTLYTFTDEDGKAVFGNHIGTNSENKFIIEVKGTGEIVIKDPKDLEEVLPYTFSVELAGKEIHYIGEPGKVTKGDLLLHKTNGGYAIAQVKAIDTKNKGARSKFNGRRILTEVI